MAADRARIAQSTRLALVERDTRDLREDVNDHETRIRNVERLGFRILAYAGVGGTLAGVATAVATVLIGQGLP